MCCKKYKINILEEEMEELIIKVETLKEQLNKKRPFTQGELERLAEELDITVLELLDLETSSADEIVKEMTEFSEVQRKMALERERISKTEIVLISIFLIIGEWIFLSLMLSFFDGWTGVILGVAFFTSVEMVICTAMIINSIRKNR